MPSMTEIYQNHSYEYDELVTHEDYLGNLPKTLNSLFDFNGKLVIELGVGTGRVSQFYIDQTKNVFCYDRSSHMLDKAKSNLEKYLEKVVFEVCDNNNLHSINKSADFVIEGWSFGHTIIDHADNAYSKIDELVSSCTSLLRENGKIIILETLGTNTESAKAPTETLDLFYSYLQKEHGFKQVIIETDYRFDSVGEASRIMGYFFGEDMAASVKEKNSPIVSEYTGLWYK